MTKSDKKNVCPSTKMTPKLAVKCQTQTFLGKEKKSYDADDKMSWLLV